MFLWVTYPIQSAIEYLWNMGKNSIQLRNPPDPYLLEILACLERAEAFAFNGDSRLIVTTLMAPFCLKRSLMEQGLPSLSKSISLNKHLAKYFTIHPDHWPCTPTGEPGIASKRCQVLTYGIPHFLVRLQSPPLFTNVPYSHVLLIAFL